MKNNNYKVDKIIRFETVLGMAQAILFYKKNLKIGIV